MVVKCIIKNMKEEQLQCQKWRITDNLKIFKQEEHCTVAGENLEKSDCEALQGKGRIYSYNNNNENNDFIHPTYITKITKVFW